VGLAILVGLFTEEAIKKLGKIADAVLTPADDKSKQATE
jgi:hypothetical protein